MLCYHFCDRKFLDNLRDKKIIIPNRDYIGENNRINAYNYLYDRLGVDSLFFAWGSKENKDEEIIYSNNGKYVLLTLNVPDEDLILTDYYNWCDVIYCLDGQNTLEDAEGIAQEEMGCSFDVVFNSVFIIKENRNIQVLLKKMKHEWIKDIKYVKGKII